MKVKRHRVGNGTGTSSPSIQAEKRVDFRALVRDLAVALPHRIELRQIGVRRRGGPALRRGAMRAGSTAAPPAHRAPPVNLGLAKDQHSPSIRRRSRAAAAGCSAASSTRRVLLTARRSGYPRKGRCSRPRRRGEGDRGDIFRERSFSGAKSTGTRIIPLEAAAGRSGAAGAVVTTAESRALQPVKRPRRPPSSCWRRPSCRRPRRPAASTTHGAGNGCDPHPSTPIHPPPAPAAGRTGTHRRAPNSRVLSGQVLPHDRHRLLERRAAPRPRSREDRGDCIARYRRLRAIRCTS